MRKKVLLVAIISCQLPFVGLAQQPRTSSVGTPPPPPTVQQSSQKPDEDVVKITTNLVQVDAVVTDNHGKIVTDLKPEELEIFEDGRKQKITHFNYYVAETSTPAPAAATAPKDKIAPPPVPNRVKPEDIRRTIALVVDDLGLSFESVYYVRRALKKFVDEQMQPGDLVAIVRTSGGMGALQQFTTDKRQLNAAIERVKWNALGRSGVTPFEPIQPPTPGDQGAAIDEQNQEMDRFRQDVFSVGTLGAVSYVVKGLRDLPGRKSILLISDGFRILNRDDPAENTRTLERLRRLIDEAGRAAVVIYTMNATGLQTLGLTAADSTSGMSADQIETQLSNRRQAAFETNEGLDYLARETGGIPIRNTNDLSGGIRRVLEDQKGFYLIGYRPDSSTFDPKTGRRTFHKLSLKVTRSGKFNVRMRNGFYGVTDAEQNTPRTLGQKMIAAAMSPFSATGVHVQLTSFFANDPTAGSYMRSVLHINASDLTFTDTPDKLHQCVMDVLAMTFGDNGAVVDQPIGRTYTIELPDQTYQRVLRQGLNYSLTVPMKKPGAYQLRVSLRDTSTERIGSASQFIDVPDLKKNHLALSGIVLRGRTANSAQPANAAANANQEGVDQGDIEASPVVRHFKRGMLMDYAFMIYNAHTDKATNQPRLTTQVKMFRGNQLIFAGKENPYNPQNATDLKRLIAGGEIQLGTDLTPGEYSLQIIVNDLGADEKHRTTTQWMDFEIVN